MHSANTVCPDAILVKLVTKSAVGHTVRAVLQMRKQGQKMRAVLRVPFIYGRGHGEAHRPQWVQRRRFLGKGKVCLRESA